MVGAWAFVDHYGPDDVAGAGMQVAPHPHTGLQTVSWLLEGEVHHRDSLGSDVQFGPGQLALMTAGHGIAHAEQSPVVHPRFLHGAQLWVALPDAHRETAPAFEHHATLPGWTSDGLTTTVLMGSFGGATSPGTAYSPLVGVDLDVAAGADVEVPLEPDFEYGILASSGRSPSRGPWTAGDALPRHRPPALRLSAPTRAGCCCSAGSRSRSTWSCGGTSSAAPARRSPTTRSSGMPSPRGSSGRGLRRRPALEAPPLPPVPLKARGRER